MSKHLLPLAVTDATTRPAADFGIVFEEEKAVSVVDGAILAGLR